MKRIVHVLLLSTVGCAGTLCLLLALPVQAAPLKAAAAAPTVYKVYRENGQYAGTVTVNKPTDLTAYASQLEAGPYRLVSVGNSATTERRIIVYQTTSLTADRRIIVY